MTKKPKAQAPDRAAPKREMVASFPAPADKPKADAIAKLAVQPCVNAAMVLDTYTKQTLGQQDLGALVDAVKGSMDGLAAGDMKQIEDMLIGQAHALQSMFVNLARRAATQEYLKGMEAFTRMALKAQSQCRMTLETLATIKNPPVVFARQANINNGGQQLVNNGAAPTVDELGTVRAGVRAGAPAHAVISKTNQTELLESSNGQRLDSRTAGETSRADPHMETVAAVHRTPHG
jgi:hypothetical protein